MLLFRHKPIILHMLLLLGCTLLAACGVDDAAQQPLNPSLVTYQPPAAVPSVPPTVPAPEPTSTPTAVLLPTVTPPPRRSSTPTPVQRNPALPTPAEHLPPPAMQPDDDKDLLQLALSPVTWVLDLAFVDAQYGWAMGRSIYCDTERICPIAISATTDGGRTWQAMPAPDTVQAGSIVPGGVERLRFVNRREGWLFRPGLFSTHNGGQSWTEHQLDGEVVTLAATAESVWLIERRCSPTRPDLCELLLMVTASDGSVWHPAQVQPPLQGNMAHLVRSGEHHAWIMHADGLAATHDGGKSWSTLALPCQTQQSQVAAALAASSSSELWLLCHGERVGSSMAKYLYSSGNGGQQWDLTAAAPLIPDDAPINNLPLAGFANDLAVTSASRIFLAVVRNTLFASSDGGQSWSAAIAPRPAWDFAEAGGIWRVVFADSLHGWAVGTALADQFVFRTSDGGSAWDIVARLPLGEVRPPPDTCQPDTGHPAEDICAPLYPTSSGPPGFRDS